MEAIMLGNVMITKKYQGGDIFELRILVQPNPYVNNNTDIIESIGTGTAVIKIAPKGE